MATDCADEAKPLGDDPSSVATVRGAKDEVERGSASARIRSMTTMADKNDQPDEAIIDNIPEDSPVPPAPPDELANQVYKPLNVKFEEEWSGDTNHDAGLTRNEMDTSGAPGRDRDDRKQPMKLQTTSERINESSKRRTRKYSPGRAQVELGDPCGEADASRASG